MNSDSKKKLKETNVDATEMVQSIMEKNQDLRTNINTFVNDRTEDNWRACMSSLLRIIHEDGMLLVPMTVEGDGDDRNIMFRLLKTPEGNEFFPLFTDTDEVIKKDPQNTAALPARKLLREFMKMDTVEALWINPWGDPFVLHKDAVQSLLDTDERIFFDRRGIYFEKGNIVDIPCECIVNSADPMFNDGGGVDHAIYEGAGDEIFDALDEVDVLKKGHAFMTPGYNLPHKAIIHTCGPVYDEEEPDIKALAQCYLSSLELAKKAEIHSIAFPAISTGASGFPKDLAAKVAVSNISYWLDENKGYGMAVILVSYDDEMQDAYADFVREAKEAEEAENE
jgi:O-acetyl-ADP-ribose deacetylase (regulator of RNase III)